MHSAHLAPSSPVEETVIVAVSDLLFVPRTKEGKAPGYDSGATTARNLGT